VLLPSLSHQRAVLAPREFPLLAASVVARQLELGVIEARALVSGRSWKLLGAVAYYAFDNAVLWATFKPSATLVRRRRHVSWPISSARPPGLCPLRRGSA
jgi:hypothetical protein